jgi:hypothetical protein
MDIVFCEAVQHCLQNCLDHLNCVKMAAFQLVLQLRKQRKVAGLPSQASRVGGVILIFSKKIPW